jgi:alkylation response protein AidB-like acyl-CoA dehydrogenase
MPMSDALDALTRVIETVVAPSADDVDRTGTFPSASLAALGDAGILGLVSATEMGGGGGAGLEVAAAVIERLAGACGSTAMVVLMHYSATAMIEAHGDEQLRRAVAQGDHLTTLAFSEVGSRSQFWAPMSTATLDGATGEIVLDARKSWVTASGHAATYVWSSRAVSAEGPMTLWAVPADTAGIRVLDGFDGFGLRGNESTPVVAEGARVPLSARMGDDGAGLDQALQVVLPWFLVLSAAFSLGLSEAVVGETRAHLLGTRWEHLDRVLAQDVLPRVELARIRVEVDRLRAFLADTLSALGQSRPDALLRVLEVKAVAAESAADVTDAAMRLGGGAAFRKETGIERRFRDARAARVMAPTTEALLDMVGRAICDFPLLGEV